MPTSIYGEFGTSVACPSCATGMLRAAYDGPNERGFPTYRYRCVDGCGREGNWAAMAAGVGSRRPAGDRAERRRS